MKSRFRSLLTAAVFIAPVIAQAHPGHDGEHELVWDFDHLVSHPLATIVCFAVLATVGVIGWQMLRGRRAKGIKVADRSDSRR